MTEIERQPGEPILVSEGSRRAYGRYMLSADNVHEIIADAIRAAEIRTEEAVLKALHVEITGSGYDLLITPNRISRVVYESRVREELGR